MSLVIVAAVASALSAPVDTAPAGERATVLALNPQPEPPGRAKIKRIYIKGGDSRRGKTIKQAPVKEIAPATKY